MHGAISRERRVVTKTKVVDLYQTSCHEKSYVDGLNRITTGHLRQAVKGNESVTAGTRGLVLFLVSKMRAPTNAKSDHWMSFDEYLLAFYPEEAFDESLYKAAKG